MSRISNISHYLNQHDKYVKRHWIETHGNVRYRRWKRLFRYEFKLKLFKRCNEALEAEYEKIAHESEMALIEVAKRAKEKQEERLFVQKNGKYVVNENVDLKTLLDD